MATGFLRRLEFDDHAAVSATLGLLQGLSIYALIETGGRDDWSALLIAGLFAAIAGPTTYYFAARPGGRLPAAILAATLGLGLGGLYLIADWVYGGASGFEPWVSALGGAGLAFIVVSFFRAATEDGGPFDYPALFKHAWTMPIIGGVAALFWLAVFLVLQLWGGLFSLIGIEFFSDLFDEAWFMWPVSWGAIGLGVALTRQWEAAILAARNVKLALARALSPVLALAAILFLASLPATGLSALWETRSATAILLAVMALTVLLINAVIGDGEDDGGAFRGLLRGAARAQSLTLPIFAVIAGYALWLRIDQYGLTVERVFAALFVGMATLYAVAYGVGALTPRWRPLVRRTNIGLALLTVLLIVVVQTPLLSPYALSARDQYARLTSGEVPAAEFDFGYLKFELGRAGEEALAAIRDDLDLPDRDIVDKRLARLDTIDTYSNWERLERKIQSSPRVDVASMLGRQVKTYPSELVLPPRLVEFLQDQYATDISHCEEDGPETSCFILSVDLVDYSPTEFLLMTGPSLFSPPNRLGITQVVVALIGDEWLELSSQHVILTEGDFNEVQTAAASGAVRYETISYRRLLLGDDRVAIQPTFRSYLRARDKAMSLPQADESTVDR